MTGRRARATSTSEPKGQELEYAARISLDRTHMQVEDKLVKLGPGMAVTVEIKTGVAQDHQLPSLAAGEIQAGSAAGAIKSGHQSDERG